MNSKPLCDLIPCQTLFAQRGGHHYVDWFAWASFKSLRSRSRPRLYNSEHLLCRPYLFSRWAFQSIERLRPTNNQRT